MDIGLLICTTVVNSKLALNTAQTEDAVSYGNKSVPRTADGVDDDLLCVVLAQRRHVVLTALDWTENCGH